MSRVSTVRRGRRPGFGAAVTLCLVILAPRSGDASSGPTPAGVLDELNLARSCPEVYARYLEDWLPRIHGHLLHRPDARPLRLREGRAAVEEAIRFLRAQSPCSSLAPASGISRGAGDLAFEQARTGAKGHVAADGSRVAERLRKYGAWHGKAAELVQYGGRDAREIVALLIVDDGVAARGHRVALFDAGYRFAGAAVGPHARYGRVCVIALATSYVDPAARAFGP